jgi:hypothetical protein
VSVRRFFSTPKGLLIVILTVLVVLSSVGNGVSLVAPGVAGAVSAAMLIDAPILRMREGEWVFPDGALLTGLIVAMILSPHEPWYVAAITSALGVVSKYLLRVRSANVFNPAALALVATFYVFDTAQSWWGALPENAPAAVTVVALGVLFATGGALFRVLHGNRSAHLTAQGARSGRVRRDRGGRQLCSVRIDRRGLLSACRIAGSKHLGSVAPGEIEGEESGAAWNRNTEAYRVTELSRLV